MVLLILTLMGCSSFAKFMPSNFDNVEFGKLVELNVISKTPSIDTNWCDQKDINDMFYISSQLEVYSANRLNENINNIYSKINTFALELKTRENPSNAYCKIKRNSIYEVTKETLSTFGNRK
jgi:hypothetical protein